MGATGCLPDLARIFAIAVALSVSLYLALSTLISMGVDGLFRSPRTTIPKRSSSPRYGIPTRSGNISACRLSFPSLLVAGFLLGFVLVTALGLETGLAIGIPLLLVLGVIFSLMFMFSGFLVIDRELGPIEAMKESYRMTYGYKWNLLGLLLLLLLINVLGLLAFIVGIFVSAPVSLLAVTHAYRVLSGGARTQPADAVLAA